MCFLITSDHQSVALLLSPVSVYVNVLCQGTGCQSPAANLYIENHVVQRIPGNCPKDKNQRFTGPTHRPHTGSHFIPPVLQDLTAAAPSQRMDISKGRTQLFARRLGRPHQMDQRNEILKGKLKKVDQWHLV